MPTPIDYLRRAYHGATEPIVPKAWVDPLADAIDSPSVDRQPWQARIQGFEAGALEGLRQQLTPVNVAMSAVPGYRAARGAKAGVDAGRAVGAISRTAPAVTAGTRAAELAAVGDEAEGAYNAARQLPKLDTDAFYRELMRKLGGRGSLQ